MQNRKRDTDVQNRLWNSVGEDKDGMFWENSTETSNDHLLKSFNHKSVLNFVKDFFCIYWDNYMFFISQFVNVVYFIDWFVDIKESLHSWDKAHLVMSYDLFNMCWILFGRILLRIFASMFIRESPISY